MTAYRGFHSMAAEHSGQSFIRRYGSVRLASALFHAVLNIEPAVIANQSLRPYLFATNPELALVRKPPSLHVAQLAGREFHS